MKKATVHNIKNLVISIATTAAKVAVAAFIIVHAFDIAKTAYEFGFRVFTEEPMTGDPGVNYTVTLTEETEPKQVAEALEEFGLIRDKDLFYVQYLLSEQKDKLVPGSYELNTSMTADELLIIMAAENVEGETDDN